MADIETGGMVERVARAIAGEIDCVDWTAPDNTMSHPARLNAIARDAALAAIEAMREPAAEAALRRIIREELDNYDRDKGVTPRMSRDGVRADWPFKLTGP